MPSSGNDHTQFICESKPACLCVPEGSDNAWDECDCYQADQPGLFKVCAGCGAQLIEINFETGDAIAA